MPCQARGEAHEPGAERERGREIEPAEEPGDVREGSERDERDAVDEDLASRRGLARSLTPNATPAHGQIGCNIWLTDMADRAPRALKNDEVLDLGTKKVRWLDTPHVPHAWEAGLLYDDVTRTLLCGDLFSQTGAYPAATGGRPLQRRCRRSRSSASAALTQV